MNPHPRLPPSACAHFACILEVTARKPGDVNRLHDFEYVTLVDYLLSAAAMAPVMDRAMEWGIGKTVLEGIRRTRQATSVNTNLGVVLLLAPLAAVPAEVPLQEGVIPVLESLTIEDARLAYEAIRLAWPGGMGRVPEQDVSHEPTVTLRQAMALAAERDLVARQYINGYQDVFHLGVPALLEALQRGWPVEEAIILCQLRLLAAHPDSLIARKHGIDEASEVSRRGAQVLVAGWPEKREGQAALRELDAWLRTPEKRRNPGTTADLVTACLFVALREGTMQVPLRQPWKSTRIQ